MYMIYKRGALTGAVFTENEIFLASFVPSPISALLIPIIWVEPSEWTTAVGALPSLQSPSASLSSNQITLPSGTYFITASAPMHVVARHKLKLRNITDSSDTLIGTSEYHNSDEQVRSFLTGRFTIASSKTFELQHYSQNSIATNGLGMQTSASVVEVYADVQIWKVA